MGKGMQPQPASPPHLLALPEGTELIGEFRIRRVLGAGGFGITYLATESALAREVTIKEYFPADYAARGASGEVAPRSRDSAKDYQWGLERFLEEAQTLARFIHPNIVRVYRCFRARASSTASSPRCWTRWSSSMPEATCTGTSPPTTSSSAWTAHRC